MTRGDESVRWAEPEVGSSLLTCVQSLGDSFAKTVGHLPFAAWDEYAKAGHVLAAVDESADGGNALMAYVAYRLPRDEVVVAQLVVDPRYRGRGLARELIHELSGRYHDRRGIRLRCRRDFEVNRMWPHLGFVSRGERPGRRISGSTLTEWWRDHGHMDLMSWQGSPPQVIPVLVDSNVFFDLHPPAGGPRPGDVQLLKDLDGDRLDIVLSPETLNEIQRNPDARERARLRSLANSYPRLVVDPALLAQWEERIRALVRRALTREQDVSDLRHVAYAASTGIEVLVTRDRPARRRYEGIAEHLGVRVTSIDEVVPLIDAQENQPAYTPQALLGTGFQLSEMTAAHRLEVAHLLANGAGERRAEFDGVLDRLARDRPKSTRLVLTDPEGRTVAVVGTNPMRGVLEVPLLRVQSQALEGTIAAQLVNQLREQAASAGVEAVRVTDPHCGAILVQALADDGFISTPTGWMAITLRRALSLDSAAAAIGEIAACVPGLPPFHKLWPLDAALATPEQVQAMEHRFRPLRLHDGPVPTFIVPIQRQYSSDLFGYPTHLFDRPDHLGISMEHVYYRGGRSNETSPARVLWYLSGEKYSEVFACSSLIDVVDADAKSLYRRFKRLGVYTYADVASAAAKGGTARALHVIDTYQFRRPITGRTLRESYQKHRQTFSVQWPTLLQPELAADLLMRGYDCEA